MKQSPKIKPVFQSPRGRQGIYDLKDPEEVAEYITMVKSFRESLRDGKEAMERFLRFGEGIITAHQVKIKIFRQMNADLISLNDRFKEVGWENIVGFHPGSSGLWPSDLQKEATETEKKIYKLYAKFKKKWLKRGKGPVITLQQIITAYRESLSKLRKDVLEQAQILKGLEYTAPALYAKRQDFREAMNTSIWESQRLRQAALEAGAQIADFGAVATQKELAKFHAAQNQILENVMNQKTGQQVLVQQTEVDKKFLAILRLEEAPPAPLPRPVKTKENYHRALRDYNETKTRLLRSLSHMSQAEVTDSKIVYKKEFDGKFKELQEALQDFFGGTWDAEAPAMQMIQETYKKDLADMLRLTGEVEEPEPEQGESILPYSKKVEADFQLYLDEWNDYADVLHGQVAVMEPFELFVNTKKEEELGSPQAQADKFQTDRVDMWENAIENWELAKQNEDFLPLLFRKGAPWTLSRIHLEKTKVDTRMKRILKRWNIIQKGGEALPSLKLRLEYIGEKVKEFGNVLEYMLISFYAKFQSEGTETELSIAQILNFVLVKYQPELARKYVRRLAKEFEKIEDLIEQKNPNNPKYPDNYVLAIEEIKEATANLSKANRAKLMNEQDIIPENLSLDKWKNLDKDDRIRIRKQINRPMQKNSIHDLIFKAFTEFEDVANEINESNGSDKEKAPKLLNVLNEALDLLEVTSHSTYRLYGYDKTRKHGIDPKKRKKEIKEKTTLISTIRDMLLNLEGGVRKTKPKQPAPVVNILIPRPKKKGEPKVIPPPSSPALSSERDVLPDPIELVEVSPSPSPAKKELFLVGVDINIISAFTEEIMKQYILATGRYGSKKEGEDEQIKGIVVSLMMMLRGLIRNGIVKRYTEIQTKELLSSIVEYSAQQVVNQRPKNPEDRRSYKEILSVVSPRLVPKIKTLIEELYAKSETEKQKWRWINTKEKIKIEIEEAEEKGSFLVVNIDELIETTTTTVDITTLLVQRGIITYIEGIHNNQLNVKKDIFSFLVIMSAYIRDGKQKGYGQKKIKVYIFNLINAYIEDIREGKPYEHIIKEIKPHIDPKIDILLKIFFPNKKRKVQSYPSIYYEAISKKQKKLEDLEEEEEEEKQKKLEEEEEEEEEEEDEDEVKERTRESKLFKEKKRQEIIAFDSATIFSDIGKNSPRLIFEAVNDYYIDLLDNIPENQYNTDFRDKILQTFLKLINILIDDGTKQVFYVGSIRDAIRSMMDKFLKEKVHEERKTFPISAADSKRVTTIVHGRIDAEIGKRKQTAKGFFYVPNVNALSAKNDKIIVAYIEFIRAFVEDAEMEDVVVSFLVLLTTLIRDEMKHGKSPEEIEKRLSSVIEYSIKKKWGAEYHLGIFTTTNHRIAPKIKNLIKILDPEQRQSIENYDPVYGKAIKIVEEEEEKKKGGKEKIPVPTHTICDIMPTLANTVIPMARYETVRIQLRRRATAHSGITSRIRSDFAFLTTDRLRNAYAVRQNSTKWPIDALAAAALDAEIYRRVFGAQKKPLKPKFDFRGNKFQTNFLDLGSNDQQTLWKEIVASALRPIALTASTGMPSLSGTPYIQSDLEKTVKKMTVLSQDIMSFILKAYLNSTDFNRVAVADPQALYIAKTQINSSLSIMAKMSNLPRASMPITILPPHWLAAEVFSYVVPAAAIPLGTDASDAALRNCGIEMVLVILNSGRTHWTLLAYPVRNKPEDRHLYHYDSLYQKTGNEVFKIMGRPDARMFQMGLFDKPGLDEGSIIIPVNNTPKETDCKQADGWSCGYAAVAFLDAIARKTETNPGLFQKHPQLYPLGTGDLPKNTKLSKTTNSILKSVQKWGKDVAPGTLWKWVQPPNDVDMRGYPNLLEQTMTLKQRLSLQQKPQGKNETYLKVGPKSFLVKKLEPLACAATRKGDGYFVKVNDDVWTAWNFGNHHTLYAVISGRASEDDDLSYEENENLEKAGKEVAKNIARWLPNMIRDALYEGGINTSPETDEDRELFEKAIQGVFKSFDRVMFDAHVEAWKYGGASIVCALVTHTWIHLINYGDCRGIITTLQRRSPGLVAWTNPMKNKTMGNFNERQRQAGTEGYPNVVKPAIDARDAKVGRDSKTSKLIAIHGTSRRRQRGDTVILMSPGVMDKLSSSGKGDWFMIYLATNHLAKYGEFGKGHCKGFMTALRRSSTPKRKIQKNATFMMIKASRFDSENPRDFEDRSLPSEDKSVEIVLSDAHFQSGSASFTSKKVITTTVSLEPDVFWN